MQCFKEVQYHVIANCYHQQVLLGNGNEQMQRYEKVMTQEAPQHNRAEA